MISPVKIWRRQKEIRKIIGNKGRIYSFTIIYAPAKDFKGNAPYPVALIKFDNKEKAIGQLVDYKKTDLKIGQRVVAVLRKIREPEKEEIITYGVKFKPI